MRTDTIKKWKNIVDEIRTIATPESKKLYHDLNKICRDYQSSNSIPTWLTHLGYLVRDKNGFLYWPEYKGTSTDIIVMQLKEKQRESNQRSIQNTKTKKTQQGKLFHSEKDTSNASVPRIDSFIKELPSELLVKELLRRGYYIYCP